MGPHQDHDATMAVKAARASNHARAWQLIFFAE